MHFLVIGDKVLIDNNIELNSKNQIIKKILK